MLIACVRTGTKYNDDYVLRLKRGVERHVPYSMEPEFVCLTDEPIDGVTCIPLTEGLPGWWSKLEAFKLGKPLLYLDLDVVIVGNLKPLLDWEGFGILSDPICGGFNSSVMRLTGNEGHVWDSFRPGVMGMMRGDQDWINLKMANVKTFPKGWVPSYKVDKCFNAVPEGAIAINFHGWPKMADISSGWVKSAWV